MENTYIYNSRVAFEISTQNKLDGKKEVSSPFKCFVCKEGTYKRGEVTVTLKRGDLTAYIVWVPAMICINCGKYLLDEVTSAVVFAQGEEAFKELEILEKIRLQQENKTRNPNRIPEILKELERAWLERPDYRLTQLLMGIAKTKDHAPNLFYMEDDELLDKMKNLN